MYLNLTHSKQKTLAETKTDVAGVNREGRANLENVQKKGVIYTKLQHRNISSKYV